MKREFIICDYEGETEGEYGTFQWLVPGTVTEEARKERDAYTGSVFVKDQLRELGGLHCCNIVLPGRYAHLCAGSGSKARSK